MSSRYSRLIFIPNESIGKYSIKRLIGQGGYGDIYEAFDNEQKRNVALKIELANSKKKALKHEYEIVKNLRSPMFPTIYEYQETPDYNYLSMELCGPSISSVRKISPNRILDPSTILRISIEMLRAIQELHNSGFLHRDIKPSNFLIRPSKKYPMCLIDYGLSCQRKIESNSFGFHPSEHLKFVGTPKYASISAHSGRSLGPCDDLYSWFISIVEMWLGKLPWSSFNDKQKILEIKRSTNIIKLIEPLPDSMQSVYKLIRRLGSDDEPNYDLIISFLVEAMKEVSASWDDQFQWEKMDVSRISALPSLVPPDNEKPNIPCDLPEPVIPPLEILPFSSQRCSSLSKGKRRNMVFMHRNFNLKF